MPQDDIKAFGDLQDEVISRDLCGKCGGCVSFCTAGTLNALEVGEGDLPRFSDEEKCLKCGICYMICPVTKDLNAEVRSRFGWSPPIGPRKRITSARATDEAVLDLATDGGVVTSLLLFMLERQLIDGAIVSRKSAAFSREPLIATTRDEIIDAAGSHFGGSSHLEELGDQYTTYSPTVSSVRSLGSENLHRVVMVGTPCQIKTIRKMQCLGILPAHIIKYTIGLFCMENFSFDAQARNGLEDRLNFNFADIAKLNVKEDLIISLRDGTAFRVPFDEIDDLARPACLACTEFANDFSDLSAGGLGSPDGYTTILVRTGEGSRIYERALREGYIQEKGYRNSAELRSDRTRMMAKVVGFARQKQSRGEERLRAVDSAI